MTITRRKLLRSALAAPALWLPSREIIGPAEAWTHGSGSQFQIPAFVSAAGFNSVTFFDDFTSSGTIDIGNTGAPGFKWYLQNTFPNALSNASGWADIYTASPTLSANINVANSILTLNKTAKGTTSELMLQSTVPNGASYNGQTFGGGGYFEAKVFTNPALAPSGFSNSASSNYGWPIFWMYPIDFFLGTQHAAYDELDIGEFFFAPQMDQGENEWLFSGTSWQGTNGLGSGAPYIQTWDATQYHTVSMMWGTAAKNGGTGYLNRYLDRVLLASGTFNWTPGNPGSALDAQQMMLILCSGVTWPFLVDYVVVCQ